MGKSAPSAPKPDPNIGRAALKQAETGEDWLKFTQDAFKVSTQRQAELDKLTKQVTDRQLKLSEDQIGLAKQTTAKQLEFADDNLKYAREDRARYKEVFQPVEDSFVDQATNYDTPERRAAEAAEAKADVQAASAQAREASQREAAGLGVNPNSGRFAGVSRANDLGTALGSAGAQNNARKQVESTGLALKADVANLGRGLPAQSSQAAAVGLNAGNSGVSNSGNAVGLGINTLGSGVAAAQNNQSLSNSATGIANAGFQGAMQGYQGQAQTLQNQYDTQVGIWQTQQQIAGQQAAGIGSALGGLAGLFFMSDENTKTDKKKVPEGEALKAVEESPASTYEYKPGMGDGGGEKHVGPMAQDMQEATGMGDGKKIAVQDMLGLHHAAIGELDKKVDKIAAAVGVTPTRRKTKAKTPPRENGEQVGLSMAA